jgi:hypothetical protein
MAGRKRTVKHRGKGFCRCGDCRANRGELNRVSQVVAQGDMMQGIPIPGAIALQDRLIPLEGTQTSPEIKDLLNHLPGDLRRVNVKHVGIKEILEEWDWSE